MRPTGQASNQIKLLNRNAWKAAWHLPCKAAIMLLPAWCLTPSKSVYQSRVLFWIHNFLKCLSIQNVNMALLDIDDAVIDKLRKCTADGFQLEP